MIVTFITKQDYAHMELNHQDHCVEFTVTFKILHQYNGGKFITVEKLEYDYPSPDITAKGEKLVDDSVMDIVEDLEYDLLQQYGGEV